jgi:hypothetical protein
MRRHRSKLLVAAVAATGLAAAGAAIWSESRGGADPPPVQGPKIGSISDSELLALQAQADNACLCARKKGDPWDKGCWADFDEKVARYEHGEWSSLCGIASTTELHFPPYSSGEGMSDRIVFKARSYEACTAEEQSVRIARAEAAKRELGCGG